MKASNITQIGITRISIKKILRDIVEADDGRVKITAHARKRMRERQIDLLQIYRCLRHGRVTEEPYPTPGGDWKVTMSTSSAGQPVTVVAALKQDNNGNRIIVVTVI